MTKHLLDHILALNLIRGGSGQIQVLIEKMRGEGGREGGFALVRTTERKGKGEKERGVGYASVGQMFF